MLLYNSKWEGDLNPTKSRVTRTLGGEISPQPKGDSPARRKPYSEFFILHPSHFILLLNIRDYRGEE
jgi:hypothetical protein